jgi:pimeloyl-ACP methyl ester carboxylesterase
MVRGRSVDNPMMVMVHGGPGSSETALWRTTNAVLEDHFTVAYWDQRGAGRSLASNADPAAFTIDRFVADLDELVDHLLAASPHSKVIVCGHSWGSVLGVLYAERHPEKVAAYVGVGQVADMVASEAASYAFALAEAEKRGHKAAIKALTAIGPPPHDPKSIVVQRRWLMAFGGGFGPHLSLPKLLWRMVSAPEGSVLDIQRLLKGSDISLKPLWPQLMALDMGEHRRFEVPVVLILGRGDMQVVATVAAAWFETIETPDKRLFWLEESGHFAPFEEPAAFNRLMTDEVRPLALAYAGG